MEFPLLGLGLSLLIGISLGFFGGGGSILTVPLLVYVFGLDAKEAITSSLLIVGLASISGALQHWRAGNVEVRTALFFGSAGMLGAYVGGRAAARLDGTLLLLLFASMMVLTAVAMWTGRREVVRSEDGSRSLGRLLIQGFSVGTFTGLVGAGGGFLIVPALSLWAGLAMPVAVGTSLAIIVMNCLAGFSGYANHVEVDYTLVGTIATTAILGSLAGSRLARLVNPASLRRSFACFVGIMASFILVRESDAWLGTAHDALPMTTPQSLFVLFVLGIGIAAGRVLKQDSGRDLPTQALTDGAGI